MAVMFRLLNNLRGTYARRQDPAHLEAVLSRMLLLKPRAADLLLERAQSRHLLLDAEGAFADLNAVMVQRNSLRLVQRARTLMERWDKASQVLH